jgi:4-aminobutyrate aminotransferase-like enzyme
MHLVSQTSLPIAVAHGEGSYLFDTSGKRYLDFTAGWCVGSVGWGNAEIRAAIETEAKRGTYAPPFLQFPAWEEFAALLVSIAPGDRLQKVIPVTSGSEAVDMAIKAARAATKKDTILSIADAYHGHTYGAASVGNAHQRITGPVVAGCEHLPMPGRSAPMENVLQQLRERLQRGDVAAFLSEPVWTNAGAYIPPKEFYPEVQRLCREHDALLVMDEVATGFGHCGKLFASELWGLEPDILCIAKAFTGGYATMGATLVSNEVYERSRGIPCYSTFAWMPHDFAAARANVEIILREKLWENADRVGKHLLNLLQPLERLPHIAEVRGKGLILAIESAVEAHGKFGRNIGKILHELQERCAAEGLLVEATWNSLFLTPHLTLTEAEAEEGAAILQRVLRNASSAETWQKS